MGVSATSLKSPSTQITGNEGPNIVWMVLVPKTLLGGHLGPLGFYVMSHVV